MYLFPCLTGGKKSTGLCRFLKDDCGSYATKMKMAQMLSALPELLQNMYSSLQKRLDKIFKCKARTQVYS